MDQIKDSLSEVVDDFIAIYEACYEGILTQVGFTPDCLMSFLFQPKILNSLMLFFPQPHLITFLCFLLPAFTYDGFLYLLMKVRTEIWSRVNFCLL